MLSVQRMRITLCEPCGADGRKLAYAAPPGWACCTCLLPEKKTLVCCAQLEEPPTDPKEYAAYRAEYHRLRAMGDIRQAVAELMIGCA